MKLAFVLVLALGGACAKKQPAKATTPTPVEKKADDKSAAPAPAGAAAPTPGDPCEGGETTKH